MLTKITDDEITYVQNSALGAVSLWRFICGYISVNNIPVPFPITVSYTHLTLPTTP